MEHHINMLIVFDITLNFLKKNMYANLLTRYDDACVITPYLFIYTTHRAFNMQPGDYIKWLQLQ